LPAKLYVQSAANQTIVKRVEEIAKKRDISMAQVSVAWSLSKEAAIHIKLTEEEIKYLEEPYEPMAILGH
ncbi:hypothetical protein C8F04DRAFT_1146611, partial [Mycena alexandri]